MILLRSYNTANGIELPIQHQKEVKWNNRIGNLFFFLNELSFLFSEYLRNWDWENVDAIKWISYDENTAMLPGLHFPKFNHGLT